MSQTSTRGKYARSRGAQKNRIWLTVTAVVLLLVLACMIAAAVYLTKDRPLELPQQVTCKDLTAAVGTEIAPSEFVSGLETEDITVDFETVPDWSKAGEQTVSLRFTQAQQSCIRQVTLRLFTLNQRVTVGLSDRRTIGISDFVADATVPVEFAGKQPAQVDRTVPGETKLRIVCDGRDYDVVMAVVDDLPPQAQGVEITFETGTVLDPAALVTGITDHSAVTATFAEPPQINTTGKHTVKILLTDAMGNTSVVESVVNVPALLVEPGFTGLSTIYIQVGDTISYKSGVKATDPQDGELTFTVDNSQVDRTKEGTYTVYYTAIDADGNTITVSRKVVVEDITRAVVERYSQKVLDKILKPGMTRDQKIRAIYQYTRSAVKFVGTSDKSSIEHSAYEGLTSGKGDCYTYYAMNRVFFEMLGIENLEVTRIGGSSHHWWNLVLFENGMYYHVDSCPVYQQVAQVDHGKMTLADLETYTNHPGVVNRRPNFYVYDQTLPQYGSITVAP